MEVEQGDFFALLGPNGAGKSTTIGVISTLVNRSAGEVEVFGRNVDTHVYETKLDLGVVPQEVNFNLFERVEDIVITQAGYYGLPRTLAKERSDKYLRQLGLWDKRRDRSRSLSGGMKRRLMIARALIHEPRLLILDEPTAGVDIELRRSMWDFLIELNGQGTTIILTTHYLEEAEQLCRNIAIIDNGAIVENTSMKSLLAEIDSQVFVLDVLKADLPKAALCLKDFDARTLDDQSIEVTVRRGGSINAVFAQLENAGVVVTSMRNKTNRLEQLFINKLTGSE
ncbi:MAG: ABC transporter ATP-binding protein [Gammaproteobacteria bacterium]|nr:ABC transporter ATP-binding protein [Gammaproteobacteria bacterium]